MGLGFGVACHAGECNLMIKWADYPGHANLHEFFLKSGDALYMVSDGLNEGAMAGQVPAWNAKAIDDASAKELVARMRETLNQSKRASRRSSAMQKCHDGFQWAISIACGEFIDSYGTKCGDHAIQNIIRSTLAVHFPLVRISQ